jgi:thymidylate synthase ThyX
MWHTVIITSGKEGLENFFNLRNHEAAEIHIQELAKRMLEVYNESTPKQLQVGEWHIPFDDKLYNASNSFKLKVSTARCARVSYTVVGEEGKEHSYENDIKLHDKLLESGHFSPFEHCAKVMSDEEYISFVKGKIDIEEYIFDNEDDYPNYAHPTGIAINNPNVGWCNNFKGFIQYRYLIENGHS